MAWVEYDSQDLAFLTTQVENLFIDEYMGKAPGDYVKVYLYGLRLCQAPGMDAPSLAEVARQLDLTPEAVSDAFAYWARRGLVEVTSKQPLAVRYRSIQQVFSRGNPTAALYPYAELKTRLESLLQGQLLNPQDLEKVLDWVEVLGFSQDAAVLLVEYCLDLFRDRGRKRASFAYMDKVAQEWAQKGLTEASRARAYVQRQNADARGARAVLDRMGLTGRAPTDGEIASFHRWTAEWGLAPEAILQACDRMTASRPNFRYLDRMLASLRQAGAATGQEAAVHYATEAQTQQELGLLQHSLGVPVTGSPEAGRLLASWHELGFSTAAMGRIAATLVKEKAGAPTLDDLDAVLQRFAKGGLVSDEAVAQYLSDVEEARQAMGELVAGWGEHRAATAAERRAYLAWRRQGDDPGLIALAAGYAQNAQGNRLSFMERVLSDWRAKGIRDVAAGRAEHDSRRASSPLARPAATPGVHFAVENAPPADEDLYFDFGESEGGGA